MGLLPDAKRVAAQAERAVLPETNLHVLVPLFWLGPESSTYSLAECCHHKSGLKGSCQRKVRLAAPETGSGPANSRCSAEQTAGLDELLGRAVAVLNRRAALLTPRNWPAGQPAAVSGARTPGAQS